MTETPWHIVELTVENVKRVRSVFIRPEGTIVTLSGKNTQGKTSVLDAIWLAVGGGQAKRDTKVSSPIHHGQDSARVEVLLSNTAGTDTLRVTRTWEAQDGGEVTTKLLVESEQGRLTSPQSILDALIKHAGFDPLAFTRLDDKSQVSELAGFVDLGFDPVEFDAATAALFNARTEDERERKRLEAIVKAAPRYPNAPDAPVDVDALYGQITEKREARRRVELMRQDVAVTAADVESIQARINHLEAELAREREALDARSNRLKTGQNQVAASERDIAAETVTLEDLEQQLRDVGETNAEVQANVRHQELRDQLTSQTAIVDGLTANIEERRKQKKDALAAAKFPVAGLGFDDGQVMYKDQPFKQASAAEQVEVSTAIAMAGNPKLRVVTIRDASLLDSEHLALIERMAQEKGYQVWLEKVDESGSVGVVIEDGRVKE